MEKDINTMSTKSFESCVKEIKREIKKGREYICALQCDDVRSTVDSALDLLNSLRTRDGLSEKELDMCSKLFLDIHGLLDDMHTFVKLVELDKVSFEKCKPLIPGWMLDSVIRLNAMQPAIG